MVHLMALHSETMLLARDRADQTLLESHLRTSKDCASALLNTFISTNGKEYTDKDLILIFDLEAFSKGSKVTISTLRSYTLKHRNP